MSKNLNFKQILSYILLVSVIISKQFLSITCYSNHGFQIVNGSIAKMGQFPYSVLILYWNYDSRCTGALLTTRHIITAAHCPYVPGGPLIQFVMAGDIHKPKQIEHNRLHTGNQQLRIFTKYIVHPKYSKSNSWIKLQFDISIIVIDLPFMLTENLQPIPVGKKEIQIGTECVFPGWGFTRFSNVCEQNDILRYHYDKIFTRKVCKIKDYTLLCGGINFGCPGDCGGSLICDNAIHGIYTYALEVGDKIHSLYTDVVPHWKWIESVTRKKHLHYYIAGEVYSKAVRLISMFYYITFYNVLQNVFM